MRFLTYLGGPFLALLELYRDGLVAFDQPAALGELIVRWTGPDDDTAADLEKAITEFQAQYAAKKK